MWSPPPSTWVFSTAPSVVFGDLDDACGAVVTIVGAARCIDRHGGRARAQSYYKTLRGGGWRLHGVG